MRKTFIKDPYWDSDIEILNDFSKIEFPLEGDGIIKENQIDQILYRRRFAYKLSQKVFRYISQLGNPLWLEVFFKYFILGKSQVEISEELHKTQAYVSYIVREIKKQVKKDFNIKDDCRKRFNVKDGL